MTKRRGQKLTPEIHDQIVQAVKLGGFPTIAAQAAGVPPDRFLNWMTTGRKRTSATRYVRFASAVDKAHAQARLEAEKIAFAVDPLSWLKSGPGKDQAGQPGWSAPPKSEVKAQKSEVSVNVLMHPDFTRILGAIMGQLAAFPEAREKVGKALLKFQDKPPKQAKPVEQLAPPTEQPAEAKYDNLADLPDEARA